MAIENATDVVVKLVNGAGGSPSVQLLHATSASLSISREMRDSTTKSSEGWSTSLAGLKSWEISGDGFVDFTGTGNNVDDLITQMLVADPETAKVTVSFGTAGQTYSGDAYITSCSVDAGVEENATYSLTLQGTGDLS
jgi:TP901-1 family phage major tail protein